MGSLAIAASPARAELSGAVDARPLLGITGRYGGAALVDLWGMRGRMRVGGALGLGALSAGDGASSRVLTPLALSLALAPAGEASGFVATLRLGGYAGAQKGGFTGGGYGSCALGYGFSLGEGASVRLAAEISGLLGARGGVFVGPALGLGF